MGFFTDALVNALFSGRYPCKKCGARMVFEDENEDILVCNSCGHSVDLEMYGREDEEDYDSLYPLNDDDNGDDDDDEDWYD